MNIQVAYTKHYFERDLILLEIDGKFTKIYKGSGLNGGKVGRILPYTRLHFGPIRMSDVRNGIIQGYIYKEFLYNDSYEFHGKDMSQYPHEIQDFIDFLEDELKDVKTEPVEQDFEHVQVIAKEIEEEMRDIIGDSDMFDWYTLVKN